MKKILTLITVLLLCTTSTWALEPGNYYFKNKRSGKYAVWTGDATQIGQSTTTSLAAVWVVNDDGKLGNMATTKLYASTTSFNATGINVHFVSSPYNDGYYVICNNEAISSQQTCWDDQGSHTTVGYWYHTSGDNEGTSWEVIAVNDKEVLLNTITAAGNLTQSDNGFGTYNTAQVTAAVTVAQAIYDSAEATSEDVEDAIAALNIALLAADNTIGDWTMMTNGRTGNNYLGLGANDNGNQIVKGRTSNAAAAIAVTFESAGVLGQYFLSIDGNYFTNCTQSKQVGVTANKSVAQTYQIARNDDGTFGIQSTDGGPYQWFHMDGFLDLVGWNQGDNPSKWVINDWAVNDDVEGLISTINADDSYTAARDLQSAEHPVVGLKPYSVTNTLTDAMDADEPDIEDIHTAYVTFANAEAVELQAGKTYRIISAYPDFETKGDGKKKAIYSDSNGTGTGTGTGMIWKAIDAWESEATPGAYYKSVWTVADISGNTITMLNLNDGSYPQAVTSNDVKTPLSRTNVNTCTLASLGAGQYNITSNGSGTPFHAGGHNSGAGTSGNIVRWAGEKSSCSAWYIQEAGIEIPTTGRYRIKSANNRYMQTTTDGLVTVETTNTGINTIFSIKRNEDGTYYIQGDDGRYVQEASTSNKVQMTTTAAKYFITRSKDGQWDFRAQATVESSSYYRHFLHTDASNKVVGWEICDEKNTDAANSHWTIEDIEEDYTYYPIELTGPAGATEMAIQYTGSTILYNNGFYAFNDGNAPTAQSFRDYADDILSTSDITVADNKVTASFTTNDTERIFTVSDEDTNAYYYIHNGNGTSWYVRATQDDKIAVTEQDKTTHGAGIFQFYEAGTTNSQGYRQYYIYNTGAQAWAKYNSVSEGTEKVELVSNKADATTWLIYTEDSGTSVDVIPGELRVTTSAQSWNAHGGFQEGKQMGLYARNDGNSTWVPEPVTMGDGDLATLKNNYVRYYAPKYTSTYSNAGELGYLKQEFIDGLSELADVTTLKETWASRTANADNYVLPSSGRFYKLRGSVSGKYAYSKGANTQMGMSDTESDYQTAGLFYFDGDNTDGFSMLDYNDGYYVYDTHSIGALGNSTKFKFGATAQDGTLSIYQTTSIGGNGRWMYDNGNNAKVDRYDQHAANYCDWYIEEVSGIPFTFNKNALGYATFCSPVAYKLDDAETKAYRCEIDGSRIKLYRIEQTADDGKIIVPKDSPVLLFKSGITAGDADNTVVNFELLPEYDETLEDNQFYGTTKTESLAEGYDWYSLQKIKSGANAGKMGFCSKTSGTLGGFKAWLQTAHQDQARSYTIYFDGEGDATGIAEALGLQDENVEIYDLSGRRLSSYQKGINIVNGKKIIK